MTWALNLDGRNTSSSETFKLNKKYVQHFCRELLGRHLLEIQRLMDEAKTSLEKQIARI
jgi:hypothetical protein